MWLKQGIYRTENITFLLRNVIDRMVKMNLTRLKDDWEEQGKIEEFNKLVNKKVQYTETLDKVYITRTELFQKMKIDNEDEQRHLVDLINNVVFERDISLQKTKTDLELCFTPNLKDKLENDKYDE